MDGLVYKATCIETGKCYIGITITSLENRKCQHVGDANRGSNLHFHRAIRKYGEESFIWEILETISAGSKESLTCCLKSLEKLYIDKYNSYHNGYNSTMGGDTMTIIEKKVKVFSEDGEFIKMFDSRREAAKFYNISEDSIGAVCNRRQKFAYTSGKRYIFRNIEDDYTESDISEVKLIKGNPYCRVEAIDLETNQVIKYFNSIKEGAEYFRVRPSTISEIVNNYGHRKSSGKYNNHKVGWRKV